MDLRATIYQQSDNADNRFADSHFADTTIYVWFKCDDLWFTGDNLRETIYDLRAIYVRRFADLRATIYLRRFTCDDLCDDLLAMIYVRQLRYDD